MDHKENMLLALEAGLNAGRAIMQVYAGNDLHVTLKKDESPLTEADRRAHLVISENLELSGIRILSEEGREISFSERRDWDEFWLVDPLDGTKEFINRNGDFTVNIALVRQGKPVLGVIYAPVEDIMYAGLASVGAWKVIRYSGMQIKDFDGFLAAAQELPGDVSRSDYTVVASRSHINEETESFIQSLQHDYPGLNTVSRGSALKFCLVAEGSADIYPRFGPTWEWDTGAGQAIAEASGCKVSVYPGGRELLYNKRKLLNPFFLVRRD